jgi:AraC-like DNA-binding protein
MKGAYQEIHPSPRLAEYVECYWSHAASHDTPSRWILPDGCVDILFSTSCGEPLALSVVGLMTAPLTVNSEPGLGFFGARFRPGMASAFIREVAQLNNRIEPLESFWGSTARLISQRLAESPTLEKMAATMDEMLRPKHPLDSSHQALLRLPDSMVPLNRLASDADLSERHFRRACVDRAGVPPKYLRRILRFRNATDLIRNVRRGTAWQNWAQFAADCGYYDQAHLIREFQEFAGCTPGRFVQSR